MWPCHATTCNALQVIGDATVTATMNWTLDTTFSAPAYVRVHNNGTVVYESPPRAADGGYVESFSLTVADEDLLTVQAKLTGSFTAVYVMISSYTYTSPDKAGPRCIGGRVRGA